MARIADREPVTGCRWVGNLPDPADPANGMSPEACETVRATIKRHRLQRGEPRSMEGITPAELKAIGIWGWYSAQPGGSLAPDR